MADSDQAARERYLQFAERVTASGDAWRLKSDEGWANCESGLQPGATVMPFWSDPAVAARAARNEWAAYQPTPIPIDRFVGRWLTNMAAEGALVGPDWDPEVLSGYEVSADDVQRQILDILGID
jgi:hypothetical protein